MASMLERDEWKAFSDAMALAAAGLLVLVGLILAVAGKDPVMAFHGCILLGAAGLAFLYILTQLIEGAEPCVDAGYADGVIRAGVIATVFWGLAGFLVGDIIAWQLAFPVLNLDLPWTTFGRLRPLHTSAVIFAFGGNALIATSFYVVQRTSLARLAGRWSPWFVFWGYQLFIVLAATGYLLGVTQSKEYAEPEWYVDLWLTVVWVVYFLVFVGTLAKRREPHIYVANWFYLAFIVTVAMLHIVNNLAVPVSLLGSKSYVIYSGVQDAMTQWWYGHNAVGFFLTAGFLGMMYYFVPKRAERPIYSYRLSIVHFWSLIFLYIWAGPHHLHYTALPDWAQTLGMTFSIMLWMPSWGGMINGLMTLSRRVGQAQDRSRHSHAGRRRGVLRHVDLRGTADEHQVGQCAVALYRLDHRPCPFRRARLGRLHHLRRALLPRTLAVAPQARSTRSAWSSGISGSRPSASCSTSPRCGCRASCKA